MASVDAAVGPPPALTASLRAALAAQPGPGASAAERLGCLLVGRARFEAMVGDQPGGDLAALPPPFGSLELPDEARAALEAVRRTADPAAPAAIGEGYGATLAASERDAHGQYVTPEPLADALVRWALAVEHPADGPPWLLDPAVGTGTFPLVAYRQLAAEYPDRPPAALLGRLVGVDVDGVALQLAGLRLGAAAGVASPGDVPLVHRSFFDCEPGGDGTPDAVPAVDAVVGNPPFVRAEALEPDVGHYRAHLAAFGPAGETPWLDGDDALSRRSDAYVYFVTQATRFLRPGGRLAVVLPTKWLMSAYGEGLRRFLRGRYRVHAIVGFDGRAFGDALVDTALLFAERAEDPAASGPMRFVKLAEPAGADGLLAAVAGGSTPTPAFERAQRALTASGSLARYLDAPADLLDLLDGPAFVRLDELATVARGTMTGANRFFFVDEATEARFGIEPRFLRPAVKSLRSVDRPAVDESAVARWLVDVHAFVAAEATDLEADVHPALGVKEALAAAGHDGLLGYVRHAEAEGWHEGRTCRSRAVWFDLGELRAPAAFVPKLLRDRVFVVRNEAAAVPSNAIDGLWPTDGVPTDALLAALNASAGKAAMEVTGRDEAGLLQLMTYETAQLPTLDVRRLDSTAARALATAGRDYATVPGPATLQALDRAVDEAFGLPMGPERLQALARRLRCRRVDGGEPVALPAD